MTHKYIQDLIFILGYKVGQTEDAIDKMSYWKAEMRYKQYIEYQKEVKKETDKATTKVK